MAGQVVGHYQVLEKIGSGGMGEVFRAYDQRLGRYVALKLIRQSCSENPDIVRRFEQEARAAASLNHANIVAVYDVGFDNDVPYIVSELLEGETLRARLSRGAIAIGETASYVLQIAHGLIAAHDRRIVHRDLKPENLFLTKDGQVKILDFGVAKLQPAPDADVPIESLTTVTKSGAVIGTVAYMSPEQLRGKSVDLRCDIFSLGAVLYEMLSGHRAFSGATEVDTMTAVLKEDPPAVHLERAWIPQEFQHIVRHCLEKEPEKRFQSARDLAFALETLTASFGGRESLRQGTRKWTRVLPWALVGLLAAAGTLLVIGQSVLVHRAPIYHRLTYESGTVYSARFAPDGQSIVYGAAWNGKPRELFTTVGSSMLVQPLNLGDANLLAVSRTHELAVILHGTNSAHLETQRGTLARVPLAGGLPRELLSDVRWADWDSNGQLAVVHEAEGQNRLEYPIGHVLYTSGGWISHIRFSPKGDKIAFMDHPGLYDDRGSVSVTDLRGNVRVLSSGWNSEDGLGWNPNSQEIWFTAAEKGNTRSLIAVNLSGRTRTVLELPSTITLQDVAADGRILVSVDSERLGMAGTMRNAPAETDLSWHDWNIAREISRDGQWLLFEDSSEAVGSGYAVALRKLDGSPPIRLGDGIAGGFSPDGKWVISISVGSPEKLVMLPTSTGSPRPVPTKLEHIENFSIRFLSDGKRIVLSGSEGGRPVRCYVQSLDGGTPVAITPEGVLGFPVSPDDRYVVGYGPGGDVALYPLDHTSPRKVPGLQLGFISVQWSEDSSALYGYMYGEQPPRIYKVDIATGKQTVIEQLPVSTGVVSVAPVVVDRSGSRFAYSYYQVLSMLYLISGVH